MMSKKQTRKNLCAKAVASSPVAAALFLLLLAGVPSCSEQAKRAWKFQSASENYRQALEAENPDDRRNAVARIAESGYVTSNDAFHVLDAVARTDAATHVRSVAVCAFTRYSDERPVPTLLAVLQATPESKKDALPADDCLREAATCALADLNARHLVTGRYLETARDLFIKLADPAAPRGVRIIALRALGTFLDRGVFPPLIRALHEQDFCLADTAERSLIALTGTTHNYDPDAWKKWLASAHDPFAHAGEKPPVSRPAGPNWWEREQKKIRDAFRRGRES
jgi:hypothetical protein